MIQQTFRCRKCNSEKIVKNGHNASGSQQYRCNACGAYGVLQPKRMHRADSGQDEPSDSGTSVDVSRNDHLLDA